MTHELNRSIVYYSTSYEDPMAYLRVIGFARANNVRVIQGNVNGNIDIGKTAEGDLIVLQRDYCRSSDIHKDLIQTARKLKKPVVFDLDDLLFELPEDHPDRMNSHYADALLPMMLAVMDADLVTVSTRLLGDYLRELNPNVEIVPNFLDDSLWNLREPAQTNKSENVTTIGFMGGQSHLPDLVMILPALKEILHKYENQVRFHFWGITPPDDLLPYSTVDFPSYRYTEFASYFQEQHIDLFIAPLRDNLFNACKSAVKFLEYSALGTAGVYGAVEPYANLISPGKDGLLAETMEDWVNSISFMIEHPRERAEIALNAREKVKNDWLLSKNASLVQNLYDGLFSASQARVRPLHPIYHLIESIASQNEELMLHHDPKLKGLTEKAEIQNQLIEHLNEEITGYTTSTSWRITRPLRMISNLFKKEQ